MKRFTSWCFAGSLAVVLATAVSAEAELKRSDAEPDASCATSTALRVPAGTETWYEGDVLRFHLPPGHVAWTRMSTGEVVALPGGGVECKCSTGDCSPIKRDDTVYCLVGPGCSTSCSREEEELALMVADQKVGVQWAERETFSRLPFATPEMLEIPAVRAEVMKFVRRAFAGRRPVGLEVVGNVGRAPEGHLLQPINVFGHLAHVLVPADRADAELAVAADSCQCNEGTGCEHWSVGWPVNVSGCDAGSCKACEMNVE